MRSVPKLDGFLRFQSGCITDFIAACGQLFATFNEEIRECEERSEDVGGYASDLF